MEREGRAPAKKSKVVESAGKVMATVFWDSKGILLIDYLPRGTTITAEHYCEVLKKLRRAIQNKRRGKLTKTVFLIHDNARPTLLVKHNSCVKSFNGMFLDTHHTPLISLQATFICFHS